MIAVCVDTGSGTAPGLRLARHRGKRCEMGLSGTTLARTLELITGSARDQSVPGRS